MAEPKQTNIQHLDPAELALKCAQFFMSLGQSCLDFYERFNKEKDRKTKLIKKAQRAKPKIARRVDGEEIEDDMKKKIPRKPLTAYIIYFQQKKPNFVQKHPDLNLSQLTKLIAKQWKQIDNDQRKPYLEQAQQDRKRYETEMKDFKSQFGHQVNVEQPENEIENEINEIQNEKQQDIQEHEKKNKSEEMEEKIESEQDDEEEEGSQMEDKQNNEDQKQND